MGNMTPPLETHENISPPVSTLAWSAGLDREEMAKIQPFIDRIYELKNEGVSGLAIAASFMRRKIQPLQERVHLGFEFTRLDDPTRLTKDEVFDEEVLKRLRLVLSGVGSSLPKPPTEFWVGNPPRAVSQKSLCLSFEYQSKIL